MTTPDHSAKRLSAEELDVAFSNLWSSDDDIVAAGDTALRAHIASLKSELSERDALLDEALEYMFNPFEPDNQSRTYNKIRAALRRSRMGEPAPPAKLTKDETR